ncbi:SRPBCC family protein [Plastoroseomonas hellenica]|uniref:SRPBCC family protein n=1 Tax=Plastoroseomonas hellenica TaxID=2687306 RepID=UPI001BAE4014|nr:SRPBCC family protein [Plastoroseomonas hellenica]MBR0642637.1 ATPase [Plastoroseomonas hellenica]
MTSAITVASVRRRIRVNAAPARAFEIFTSGMTRWWPRAHSINASPIQEIVMEPRVGGRWLERGEDGSECQWGRVLAWEPPVRLMLAWQISVQWRYDPAVMTEVEVRFLADGDGTVVELEHRLNGYGEAAEQMRQIFDTPKGWQGVLENFAGCLGPELA